MPPRARRERAIPPGVAGGDRPEAAQPSPQMPTGQLRGGLELGALTEIGLARLGLGSEADQTALPLAGTERGPAVPAQHRLGDPLLLRGSHQQDPLRSRRAIKTCEPVGEFVNDQVNGVAFMHCAEDDGKGKTNGLVAITNFMNRAAYLVSRRDLSFTRLSLPLERRTAPQPSGRRGRRHGPDDADRGSRLLHQRRSSSGKRSGSTAWGS